MAYGPPCAEHPASRSVARAVWITARAWGSEGEASLEDRQADVLTSPDRRWSGSSRDPACPIASAPRPGADQPASGAVNPVGDGVGARHTSPSAASRVTGCGSRRGHVAPGGHDGGMHLTGETSRVGDHQPDGALLLYGLLTSLMRRSVGPRRRRLGLRPGRRLGRNPVRGPRRASGSNRGRRAHRGFPHQHSRPSPGDPAGTVRGPRHGVRWPRRGDGPHRAGGRRDRAGAPPTQAEQADPTAPPPPFVGVRREPGSPQRSSA